MEKRIVMSNDSITSKWNFLSRIEEFVDALAAHAPDRYRHANCVVWTVGTPRSTCDIACPAYPVRAEEAATSTTNVSQGLFLILVGCAQAPVWSVGANHHLERKKPMPYVNHYSFHVLDPEWRSR
jgi:hypothetical protein